MILQNTLLTIALALGAPWYGPGKSPETAEQFQERMKTVTEAIALEAREAQDWQWGEQSLAAATLATWFAESRFALEVHNGSGKTRHGEDDGRAKCFGQLHQTGYVPKEEWKKLTGTDLESTRRCARATMRVLTAQTKRCRVPAGGPNVWSMSRVFTVYTTGKSCSTTKRGMMRARHWGRIMAQLAETASAGTTAQLAQPEKTTATE